MCKLAWVGLPNSTLKWWLWGESWVVIPLFLELQLFHNFQNFQYCHKICTKLICSQGARKSNQYNLCVSGSFAFLWDIYKPMQARHNSVKVKMPHSSYFVIEIQANSTHFIKNDGSNYQRLKFVESMLFVSRFVTTVASR